MKVTYKHVDCQFKFILNDLDQDVLRDKAILVWLATQGHECVEVLIHVALLVVRQLLILVPFDCHEQATNVKLGEVLAVEEFLNFCESLIWQSVTASCIKDKTVSCVITG